MNLIYCVDNFYYLPFATLFATVFAIIHICRTCKIIQKRPPQAPAFFENYCKILQCENCKTDCKKDCKKAKNENITHKYKISQYTILQT